MPYLSDKDESDLIFGVQNDVDFVAASFVRRKEDVISLKRFLIITVDTTSRLFLKSKILKALKTSTKYSDIPMVL